MAPCHQKKPSGYKGYQKKAFDAAVRNLNRNENIQRRIEHVPRFRLLANADAAALNFLLRERHVNYCSIRSFDIDGTQAFEYVDAGVPATPPTATEPRFHIVEFRLEANGPSLDLLFREQDNYYIAWRRTPASRATPGGWFTFFDIDDLPDYLGKSKSTMYNSGYVEEAVDHVKIWRGMLTDIHEFLWNYTSNFDDKRTKATTFPGMVCHAALMFVLGEGQRFPTVRNFVVQYLPAEREAAGSTTAFLKLIKDWDRISKAVLCFKLALLEHDMAVELGRNMDDHLRSGKWQEKAEFELGKLQTDYPDLVLKDPVTQQWSLPHMVGHEGAITLLKHNRDLGEKIMMRVVGFSGRFM